MQGLELIDTETTCNCNCRWIWMSIAPINVYICTQEISVVLGVRIATSGVVIQYSSRALDYSNICDHLVLRCIIKAYCEGELSYVIANLAGIA